MLQIKINLDLLPHRELEVFESGMPLLEPGSGLRCHGTKRARLAAVHPEAIDARQRWLPMVREELEPNPVDDLRIRGGSV